MTLIQGTAPEETMAKNKSQKPKARLPRGFGDRMPADIRRTNAMMETIRSVS